MISTSYGLIIKIKIFVKELDNFQYKCDSEAMLNIFYPNLPQSLSSEPSLQSGKRLQRALISIHALPSSQRNSVSGLQVKGSM